MIAIGVSSLRSCPFGLDLVSEFVECGRDSKMMAPRIGAEFVVAAPQILH